MKEYEVIREIFNLCSGNQMRDTFVDEIFIDDPEQYVRDIHKNEPNFTLEKTTYDDHIVIDIKTEEISQRYTFTEI